MDTQTPEPKPPPKKAVVVGKSDTLKSIAAKYKVTEQSIWNDPDNRALVSKRGKPENIQPSDDLIIPPTEAEMQDYQQKLEEYRRLLAQGAAAKTKLAEVEKLIQLKLTNIATGLDLAVKNLVFYWDVHNSLYNPGNIVGWLLHNVQGMPSPMPVGPLNKARSLVQALKPAINAGQFGTLESSIPAASAAVEEAYNVVISHQAKLQVSGSGRVAGFRCVNISFAMFKGITNLRSASRDLITMAAASTDVDELEAFAKKITYSDGTQLISKALLVTAVTAGITGLAIRDKGWPKRLVHNIAKQMAPGISFGGMSKDKIANLITKWIETAGKSPFEAALDLALNAVKDGSTSVEQFVSNVAKALVDKVPINGVYELLDKNLVSRATAEVDRLIKQRLSILDRIAKAAKAIVQKVVKRVMPNPPAVIKKARDAVNLDKLYEKVLEEAIASAKTPKDIADQIISRAMSDKSFLSNMEKQIEQLLR